MSKKTKPQVLYVPSPCKSQDGYALDNAFSYFRLGHNGSSEQRVWAAAIGVDFKTYRVSVTEKTVKDLLAVEGYTLDASAPTNSKDKFAVKCPNGHAWTVAVRDFKKGVRCPTCSGYTTMSPTEVMALFRKEGYEVLRPLEYKNALTKIDVRCPQEHKWSVRVNDFKTGYRCRQCSIQSRRVSTVTVEKMFAAHGYVADLSNYVNGESNVATICPKKHKWQTTFNRFNFGYRCKICQLGILSKEEITEVFLLEGYKVDLTEYKDTHSHITITCPEGHSYTGTYKHFHHRGQRCPVCRKRAQ